MTSVRLTVIIVSRHRPDALRRCLTALRLQDLTGFEVVVVADAEAISGLTAFLADIKAIVFEDANISVARNIGLAEAAGDVVAFVDDDAVPEPTWASRLTAPFLDASVVAATGFVRGRNGISLQWQAAEVDLSGRDHPIVLGGDEPFYLPTATPNRAIKTVGTNAAFRVDTLRQIGGFDPLFRFFLEDADVNIRLSGLGQTAVVPLAQVQHGFDASERRRKDRTPVSLFEIAASTAVFLRKHAPLHMTEGEASLRQSQRRRLISMMIDGRLEPHQVGQLLHGLDQGWADGLTRKLTALVPLRQYSAPFKVFAARGQAPGRVLSGRIWARRTLRRQAAKETETGAIVTCICLSPSNRPHWEHFREPGFWEIRGGIWGKADRSASAPMIATFSGRVAETLARIAKYRPVSGSR